VRLKSREFFAMPSKTKPASLVAYSGKSIKSPMPISIDTEIVTAMENLLRLSSASSS
jgi:hypothetical protein